MSRFDGWLVRYIMMRDTPAALSIKAAAKGACTRPETFAQALHDPAMVRQDARCLGADPDEMLDIQRWVWQLESEHDVAASMLASAAARTPPKPSSEKYRGSVTRLGVTCPHPPSGRWDALNLPVNPIEHPEPEGEWHDGLNAAGPRYRY